MYLGPQQSFLTVRTGREGKSSIRLPFKVKKKQKQAFISVLLCCFFFNCDKEMGMERARWSPALLCHYPESPCVETDRGGGRAHTRLSRGGQACSRPPPRGLHHGSSHSSLRGCHSLLPPPGPVRLKLHSVHQCSSEGDFLAGGLSPAFSWQPHLEVGCAFRPSHILRDPCES